MEKLTPDNQATLTYGKCQELLRRVHGKLGFRRSSFNTDQINKAHEMLSNLLKLLGTETT